MNKLDRFFYNTYKSAYPAGLRRRSRFTPTASVIGGAIVASAVFGLNTMEATVYQFFTVLSALFITALISSLFFRGRFSAERTLPPFATAGEKFSYTVRIRNLTCRRQGNLIYQEIPTIKYPSFEEFLQAREPHETNRNRWDRLVRLHRFNWLMQQHTRISPKEQHLPTIGANSYTQAYIELEAHRRGYLQLTAVHIKRTDPLGLFKARITLPLQDRLLILPKRFPLPKINLPGSRKHHSGGIALASSIGNADEFHSLREYLPGDPMRMLHWKSVAKTGELIIRQNEDEYFVRHALILDTFEPGGQRFETAISIAASFACAIRTQESMLDLLFVEDQAHCLSTGRGVDHTSRMLEILACIEPCTNKTIAALFPLVAEHSALLSGCICIFQSWDDERKKMVHMLTARGVSVKVLVVTDQEIPVQEESIPLHIISPENPEKGLAEL